MALPQEYVENKIFVMKSDVGKTVVYQLDFKMCQLSTLEYDFDWGGERYPAPQIARLTEQPSKIWKLDCSLNNLTVINDAGVKPFINLRVLDASLNRVKRVSNLHMLHFLTHLNLSHNNIRDIDFLQSLGNLVEVNLSMNDLESITRMPSLVNLHILYLNDNKLTSLQGVQAVPYLKELHFQRNGVTNIAPLIGNRNLMCLNGAHNSLKSLHAICSVLAQLTKLRSLMLYGNPVEHERTYQEDIAKLTSVFTLDNITLRKVRTLQVAEESENISNIKEAAKQAFWNQLTSKRNEMEENIRFMQQRILQQQEEFQDYEEKLKNDLESTLLHLEHLTEVRRKPPDYLTGKHGLPESSTPHRQQSPVKPSKKGVRGIYQGITNPEEILRLASTELAKEKASLDDV